MEVSNKKEEHSDDAVRPMANYPPSVWGEFFIHFVPPVSQKDHAWMKQRVEELKEEVKSMFETASGDLEEEMNLVDTLQRLGLAYHFEEELRKALLRIHDAQLVGGDDLRAVALRFRLLRQEGYNVSSAEFNRFKDVNGNFRRSLASDVKALLTLYEAAYLGTQADAVLDEAITFCKGHLEALSPHLQPPLAAEVARALETPLIRRVKRVEARQYISYYEATQGRNDLILELATLDFNLLQSLHQEEIRNLSVWWKELGIINKLSFARDRLVECYSLWALGVYYEPCYSRARMMMTKVVSLVSVLDDMYDSYGMLEELNLFTSIILRWDVSAMEELPEYMKIYFVALTDAYKEFEEDLKDEQKSYRVDYVKEQLKLVAMAYLEEAKWSNKGYVPTLEEHLHVSLITTAYQMLASASFLGMGDNVTKETFDRVKGCPKIVKASMTICRLMDDIVADEFDQMRQHVASTVQCYMNEHGVSKEKTCQKLCDMVEDAWKVTNQECLRPSTMPLQLLMSPFNLSRVMETFYKRSDGYTSSRAMDLINLMLVNCA